MLEIKPISHTYPVLKPENAKRDDRHLAKRQTPQKPAAEKSEPEQPLQPIDEMA